MKSVVVLTSHFEPETFAPAKRIKFVVDELVRRGFNTTVVAPYPHYPQRKIFPGFYGFFTRTKRSEDCTVLYVRPMFYSVRNPVIRLFSETIYCLLAFFVGLTVRKPDFVFASSPFMFLGFSGLFLARMKSRPFVWDIRDLTWKYLQVFSPKCSAAVSCVLEKLMMMVARRADVVSTSNNMQKTYFNSVSRNDVIVYENGVEDSFFESTAPLRSRKSLSHDPIVMYAGLIGYPQGVSTLIDAVSLLRGRGRSIKAVIAGDGVERGRLIEKLNMLESSVATLTGYLNTATLIETYKTADILWAQLCKKKVFESARPSKLLEYMAVGRPIIFGGEGEGKRLIEKSQAGLAIAPEDSFELANAIERLLDDGDLRERLRKNGEVFVSTNLRSTLTKDYLDVLGERIQSSTSGLDC